MAYTVTLQPGEQHFEAEAHESLLNAALRAGLALDYGCSNGNCGHCKARILQGHAEQLRPYDYPLSATDRQDGHILLCSYCAASDLVLEAHTADSIADIPLQHIDARIRRTDNVGDNTLVLQLRTPRSRSLRFIAGQHARVTLDNGLQRELPIASCPCDGMNLEFHIYRDAADRFSEYIFAHPGKTMPIHIEGPVGDFTLDEDSRSPIIFIAWEAGFGPIRSLIEHSLSLELTQAIQLYWIVHNKDGHYADGYCRAVADAIDNFVYTPLCVGEIDCAIQQIAYEHNDLSANDVYMAVPPAVAEQLRQRLAAQGLSDQHVKVDPLVA